MEPYQLHVVYVVSDPDGNLLPEQSHESSGPWSNYFIPAEGATGLYIPTSDGKMREVVVTKVVRPDWTQPVIGSATIHLKLVNPL
jgi:hypothetical protein